MMKVVWLALLILLNAVHLGKGLAADRNLRWSVDEPTATDDRSTSKEDAAAAPLQNASHLHGSVSVHNSSREEELEREARGELLELTVANQSLSTTVYSHEGANVSVPKSSNNRTSLSLNVSLSERALNVNTGNSTPDSRDASNSSRPENVVHTTLCVNGSIDKETMRVKVEFASTVLENGLYHFIPFNNNKAVAIDISNCINKM